MTKERAQQIVDACAAHPWYEIGLREEPPPSLAEYSLRELLDANDMMAGPEGTTQNPDGTTNRAMHCDDRLVAALYTLYHFQADRQEEVSTVVNNEHAGVVVLRLDRRVG